MKRQCFIPQWLCTAPSGLTEKQAADYASKQHFNQDWIFLIIGDMNTKFEIYGISSSKVLDSFC